MKISKILKGVEWLLLFISVVLTVYFLVKDGSFSNNVFHGVLIGIGGLAFSVVNNRLRVQ